TTTTDTRSATGRRVTAPTAKARQVRAAGSTAVSGAARTSASAGTPRCPSPGCGATRGGAVGQNRARPPTAMAAGTTVTETARPIPTVIARPGPSAWKNVSGVTIRAAVAAA